MADQKGRQVLTRARAQVRDERRIAKKIERTNLDLERASDRERARTESIELRKEPALEREVAGVRRRLRKALASLKPVVRDAARRQSELRAALASLHAERSGRR